MIVIPKIRMSTRILKFHFGTVTKLMISTLDDEKHDFLQKLVLLFK